MALRIFDRVEAVDEPLSIKSTRHPLAPCELEIKHGVPSRLSLGGSQAAA